MAELTSEPGSRENNRKLTQMMTWSHSTYLKMIIKLKAEIDMLNYPMWYIVSPQMVNKEHATQVIEGWNNGAI